MNIERKSGIGASMAPVICDCSPYMTSLEAALWYRGEIPDQEETDAMLLGTEFEPGIRKLVAKKLDTQIVKPETRRHPEHRFMYASPDGIIETEHGLEIKWVSHPTDEWGQPGTDEVPEHVVIQCQQQAAVFDFRKVTVAALVWGQLRLYCVPRSEPIIARLVEIEGDFWTRLKAGILPEPTWRHPSTPDLVAAMYGVDEAKTVELDPGAIDLADAYREASERIKVHEQDQAAVKAQLLHLMGDASVALLPDGRTLSRKQIARKSFTVDETSFIDFRIKQPKKEKVIS